MAKSFEDRCLELSGKIPVAFVLLILAWATYAYNVALIGFTVEHIAIKVLLFPIYNGLLYMVLWCYWKSIVTKVMQPPAEFGLTFDELRHLDENDTCPQSVIDRHLPLLTHSKGRVRYCVRCCCIKPDRAHHCSSCRKCVLKYDHHCPWINNCVGFHNYKFFYLFLMYAFVFATFIFVSTLPYTISAWPADSVGNVLNVLMLTFLSFAFAISIGVLFGVHSSFIARNKTTVESHRRPTFWVTSVQGFNLGEMQENLEQVFGEDKRTWLKPVGKSIGDGVQFPLGTDSDLQKRRAEEFLAHSHSHGHAHNDQCCNNDTALDIDIHDQDHSSTSDEDPDSCDERYPLTARSVV